MDYLWGRVNLMTAILASNLFSGVLPAEVTFLGSDVGTDNTSSYSWTSVNFGAAASDRFLVVAVYGDAGSTNANVNSVTIGGVSASLLGTAVGNGTTAQCQFWGAIVPTGTSGTIAISFSATRASAAYGLWSISKLLSTTPVDSYSDTDSTLSGSVSVVNSGVLLAAASVRDVTSFSWTGVSENFDSQVESVSTVTGGSLALAGTASGSVTVTAAQAAGTTTPRMSVISLR
jgi:hypothetical protein